MMQTKLNLVLGAVMFAGITLPSMAQNKDSLQSSLVASESSIDSIAIDGFFKCSCYFSSGEQDEYIGASGESGEECMNNLKALAKKKAGGAAYGLRDCLVKGH